MQINQLKIEGILGIKLGTPFHNKTVKQTFQLSHKSDIKGMDFFSDFETVVLNIDPLNKKVFQIYSILQFQNLDVLESKVKLKEHFENLKNHFVNVYGIQSTRLNNESQIVFSIDNNEISIKLENNSLILECTDQILKCNCYALLAAY